MQHIIKSILVMLLMVTYINSKEVLNHVTNTNYNMAVKKIIKYAKIPTSPQPTFQDYIDINISGITSENINNINQKIIKREAGERDKAYRYTPKQDYSYDFKNTNVKILSLKLENLKINLNNNNINSNTSVFLKIDINTTKLGQYFTPKLSILYKNKSYIHTFEPGAQGYRYLNLSALDFDKDTKLTLKSKFITLANQNIELYIFKNPEVKNKKILIIAPHPDDAEIAAYGLYSMYHDNIHIITVTAGDAGSNDIYNNIYKNLKEQFLAKGKRRTLDSIFIPMLGGVIPEHAINLGYFDSKLNSMRLYRHKPVEIQSAYTGTTDINTFRQYNISSLLKNLDNKSTWDSLVNNLTDLLNKIQPDIIVTPHPKLDRHLDHKLSSEALFEALKKSNIREGNLFLYTNHATGSEYYPYGNVEEAITLPPVYGKSIYFNSIYSHEIPKNTQNDKIFSLEAMTDLRFTPQGSIFQSPCKDKLHLLCKDYSYLRRAARSNELFFIINIKNML